MRIRTIDRAAEYFRDRDPDTDMTKTALRRLVTTGEIQSIRVGAKYLVDLDILEETLFHPAPASPAEEGKIRRISVNGRDAV